jgi:N6-L-threonylcarbamoyladenine synthase
LGFGDLDCVAVTRGPGLVGSLLVGVNMAKGLAVTRNLPLLGINHIEGHIYSLWLTEDAPHIRFPVLTLVVSGGHTELYLMTDHGQYQLLGATLDDAAGEAFDKVGRLLGLPFPGGPAIDAASDKGNPTAFRFPRAVMDQRYVFSFSGLKTALVRQVSQYHSPALMPVADLAASFQAAVVGSGEQDGGAAAATGDGRPHCRRRVGQLGTRAAMRRSWSCRCACRRWRCAPTMRPRSARRPTSTSSAAGATLDLDVVPSLQLLAQDEEATVTQFHRF